MVEYPLVPEFLKVRVHVADQIPSLLGLCAGYENEHWRSEQFAQYILKHIPQFSLPIEKWDDFHTATGLEMITAAAKTVYTTTNYQNRGEIGEILLYAILRRYFDTLPIVSKFFFKSASNDTVKGFDGIHFSISGEEIALWLGEVKFYRSYTKAVGDVIAELNDHLQTDFLREEFMWTSNKLSQFHPEYEKIQKLIDSSNSLDAVIASLNIAVLITYESKTISNYKKVSDDYLKDLVSEINKNYEHFCQNSPSVPVNIHVILVPLGTKAKFVESFDERLNAMRSL